MYPESILETIKSGKLKEGLYLLLKYTENNVFDIAAYCDIGYILINLGSYNKAIEYLNLALEFSKIEKEFIYRPTICLNLAVAHKMNGNEKKLITEYKLSLKYINLYFEYTKNNPDENILQAKDLKEDLERKIEENTKYASNEEYSSIMQTTINFPNSPSSTLKRRSKLLKSHTSKHNN